MKVQSETLNRFIVTSVFLQATKVTKKMRKKDKCVCSLSYTALLLCSLVMNYDDYTTYLSVYLVLPVFPA